MKKIGHALWRLSDLILSPFGFGATYPAKPKTDAAHLQWLAAHLAEVKQIKVGMSRAELCKTFVPQSAKNLSARECFCCSRCSLIRIEVVFKNDRIIELSKPYLQSNLSD